jgi:signal transduction histidine kinase/ligand-binding sensor domain-containing protein/DNA-binding response OmpR family regulator
MRFNLLVLLVFVCFITMGAFAQGDKYQFSHIDIDNGLLHNRVLSIYKDTHGFMWFGTLSGLNRYDGYKFKSFNHKISDPTSISDDFIINISSGPENELWVQTLNGFNIYNPQTEQFDHHIQKKLSQFSIPDSLITKVKQDHFGNYCFLHSKSGMYVYDPKTHQTKHFYNKKGDSTSLYSNALIDMESDSHGNYWMIYDNGVIEKLDFKTQKVTKRIYTLRDLYPKQQITYNIYIDQQDDLWAFAPKSALGVFYFNTSKNVFKHLTESSSQGKLNFNIVYGVIQDSKGIIWIATDHGGINLLNKKDFTIQYITNRPDDSKSLCENSIISMYKDDLGIFWIGTFKKGISYYHPGIIKFPIYRHQSTDVNSLSCNDINKFVEDKSGNIWIGSNGGGLIYFNRQTGVFKKYLHDNANPASLCNNVIASMCIDHTGKLWLGTYYGGMDCFDGKTFKHYRHNAADINSVADDCVWEIMEDSQQRLWVGTLKGGLDLFDRDKNKFYHHTPDHPASVNSLYVSGLLEDYKGNIWISSTNGVDMLDVKTNRIVHLAHEEDNKNSLINNNVSNIIQDSRHFIILTTNEGLSIFNPFTGIFKNFRQEDGLPDNATLMALEDDNHNYWISTPKGLSNMIVTTTNGVITYKFKNYDKTDGLQGQEFNEDAGLKTRKGEMIFGGSNGFNLFKPSNIRIENNQPILALTDFQLFNKSIHSGEKLNGSVILTKSITNTKEITLKYNQNVFAIEFAAINFFNPAKIKQAYKLEGVDKDWVLADNKTRKAYYMNLDPGTYLFKLKNSNENGVWYKDNLVLKITVLPPFWKTKIAYSFYALLAIGILFYIRHKGIKKIKANFLIEQERQETQRMHELDLMKIKFFTNVSHEFRTPLSLILAPLDTIIKNPDEPDQKRQLLMIRRNAKRMLNLVNQLLDFRKMEVHELKLNTRTGNLVKYIEETAYSFTDIAERRNIEFLFDTEVSQLNTNFDADKIERILFNLLSNAFKFTPEHGLVSVMLAIKGDDEFLEIKVMDTGIGIPHEKLDKIFERFFQNDIPGSMVNQGSGIGLSITKEFVKLHNGQIEVESEVGYGSCFTILLPINLDKQLVDLDNTMLMEDDFALNIIEEKEATPKKTQLLPANPLKKPTILLIEDNEDFRFYLKDNLKSFYHIIEACNGKEGWQKTLAMHPSLVVSDINMPEMNGIDLTKKIKNDTRTMHIPVILVTALTGEDEQLKGLETGANDYLTKPFNFEILLSKIKNLLSQQTKLKQTYQKQVELNPMDSDVQSLDEKFSIEVIEFIEKRMSNPDLSVEELSSKMAMSRVTLYRKLLALTGKTPVEFIKTIRLKRSLQLLEKGQMNIAEVAYAVGFNNPKYFARLFKSEYNMLPSEYKNSTVIQNKEEEPATMI